MISCLCLPETQDDFDREALEINFSFGIPCRETVYFQIPPVGGRLVHINFKGAFYFLKENLKLWPETSRVHDHLLCRHLHSPRG